MYPSQTSSAGPSLNYCFHHYGAAVLHMSHCLLMPLQNLLVAQKLFLAHHLIIDAFFLLWYTGGEHKIQAAITFAPFHKTLPWWASHPFTHWFSLCSPSHLVFLIALCPVSSLYLLASLFPLEEAVSSCSVADRKSCIWMQHAKSFKCVGLLQTFALRGTSLMWDGDWFNWKQWSWWQPDEITHTCLFQTSHKQRCKIPGILLQVTSSNCGVLLQFFTCSIEVCNISILQVWFFCNQYQGCERQSL